MTELTVDEWGIGGGCTIRTIWAPPCPGAAVLSRREIDRTPAATHGVKVVYSVPRVGYHQVRGGEWGP